MLRAGWIAQRAERLAAANAIDEGTALTAVQEMLGHSDIRVTRRYVHTASPLAERKLAAMFGKTSRRWARSRMAEARQTTVATREPASAWALTARAGHAAGRP
jgi:hypothetical protein